MDKPVLMQKFALVTFFSRRLRGCILFYGA